MAVVGVHTQRGCTEYVVFYMYKHGGHRLSTVDPARTIPMKYDVGVILWVGCTCISDPRPFSTF